LAPLPLRAPSAGGAAASGAAAPVVVAEGGGAAAAAAPFWEGRHPLADFCGAKGGRGRDEGVGVGWWEDGAGGAGGF